MNPFLFCPLRVAKWSSCQTQWESKPPCNPFCCRRWTEVYTISLNKWKSSFHFPIYRNILSVGSFKKLKRGFGTILTLQSCKPTCTSCFPCPSGYGHPLWAGECLKCIAVHGIRLQVWCRTQVQMFFFFFFFLGTDYSISKPILACTSDMKHFSVII